MTTSAIWFQVNGGDWNADAGASPSMGIGGIPITILPGLLYPVVVGSNAYNTSCVATLGAGIGTWNPFDYGSDGAPGLYNGDLSLGVGGEGRMFARGNTSVPGGVLTNFTVTFVNVNSPPGEWVGVANFSADLAAIAAGALTIGAAVVDSLGDIQVNGTVEATGLLDINTAGTVTVNIAVFVEGSGSGGGTPPPVNVFSRFYARC